MPRRVPRFLFWPLVVVLIGISTILLYPPISSRIALYRWNPDNAVAEAQQDIRNGTIKIYRHGTVVSQPVGVTPEQMSLISKLPTKPAGVGCIVNDMNLRNRQGEYAIRYNQTIVQHLQQQSR